MKFFFFFLFLLPSFSNIKIIEHFGNNKRFKNNSDIYLIKKARKNLLKKPKISAHIFAYLYKNKNKTYAKDFAISLNKMNQKVLACLFLDSISKYKEVCEYKNETLYPKLKEWINYSESFHTSKKTIFKKNNQYIKLESKLFNKNFNLQKFLINKKDPFGLFDWQIAKFNWLHNKKINYKNKIKKDALFIKPISIFFNKKSKFFPLKDFNFFKFLIFKKKKKYSFHKISTFSLVNTFYKPKLFYEKIKKHIIYKKWKNLILWLAKKNHSTKQNLYINSLLDLVFEKKIKELKTNQYLSIEKKLKVKASKILTSDIKINLKNSYKKFNFWLKKNSLKPKEIKLKFSSIKKLWIYDYWNKILIFNYNFIFLSKKEQEENLINAFIINYLNKTFKNLNFIPKWIINGIAINYGPMSKLKKSILKKKFESNTFYPFSLLTLDDFKFNIYSNEDQKTYLQQSSNICFYLFHKFSISSLIKEFLLLKNKEEFNKKYLNSKYKILKKNNFLR